MNIQAMMKQAQKIQKEMTEAKEQIDKTEFEGSSSFVTIRINGAKKTIDVKINKQNIDKDDIEMLQDMILLAFNDATNKVDKEVENKLGKYTQGMPGLF